MDTCFERGQGARVTIPHNKIIIHRPTVTGGRFSPRRPRSHVPNLCFVLKYCSSTESSSLVRLRWSGPSGSL